jgi:hypothetical protein
VRARLLVDGKVVADPIGALPVEIDPGEHFLRLELDGAEPEEQRIIAREGDNNRVIDVRFQARPTAPIAPPRPKVPALGYVFGGISLASLGVFTGFAIGGKLLERDRAATCGHRCTDAEVAPVRRDYAIADVALITAAATAIATVVVMIVHSRAPKPRPSVGQLSFTF